MEKEKLSELLMDSLWKVSKLELMFYLREFAEGEMAAMLCLYRSESCLTPSQMSDNLKISRARMTNILRTLRAKDYVKMDMSDDDRRKMPVSLTQKGAEYVKTKLDFLQKYLELYVEEMGEEAILRLVEIMDETAACQLKVVKKLSAPKTD